jgi:hypothetical protein
MTDGAAPTSETVPSPGITVFKDPQSPIPQGD